jgi:predicted transcriptional regulator
MGRRRRDGNHSPQKNNLTQSSEGNEENRYPAPNPNKTMINNIKETSDAHKKILQEITENFMEKIVDVTEQNVDNALKNFQDTKNKEHEKTQKQINGCRGALNKHKVKQRTLEIEINELKMKIKNVKEVTQDMEISEKRIKQKHKTQRKATPAD